MVYQWRIPGIIPVDAQTAGTEFDRILSERGKLDAETVVNESRPKDAVLHSCFEWDDAVAAEEYRKTQAQKMLRMIHVVEQKGNNNPVSVRAFIHTREESYQPIRIVMGDADLHDEMLKEAMRELLCFKNKYENLAELNPVFDAMDRVQKQTRPRNPVSNYASI